VHLFCLIQQASLRQTTIDRVYRPAFKSFIGICGDKALNQYCLLDVEYFKAQRSRQCSLTTVNIEFRTLKAAFGLAVRLGLLDNSPFKRSTQVRVPDKLPAHLSEDDFRRLTANTDEPILRDLFILAALTGLRQGEILNLRWTDVDLGQKVILVANSAHFLTKSGRCRTVAMHEEVFSLLTRLRSTVQNAQYVFEKAGRPLTQSFVSHKFKRYVRAAGLPESLKFHSLRHTFATWLVQRSASLYEVQTLLGHSSVKTTQIYAHLSGSQMHATVNKIDWAI
jgi:integrase